MIEVRGLTKRYGPAVAVDGLSFAYLTYAYTGSSQGTHSEHEVNVSPRGTITHDVTRTDTSQTKQT